MRRETVTNEQQNAGGSTEKAAPQTAASPNQPQGLVPSRDATVWDGESVIPISEWGRDHWSTLAYIETCVVDQRGRLGNAHMRCNPRLHRRLVYVPPLGAPTWDDRYSTRLRGGRVAHRHDDWSCLEDMEALGLLTTTERDTTRRAAFGGVVVTAKLTERGIALAAELRAHKARGGSYVTFAPATSSSVTP